MSSPNSKNLPNQPTVSSLVFVIVLQYNNSKDTINCLDSLRQLKYRHFKVAVIDNASQEAEKNVVRNYINRNSQAGVILLENRENLGYAGGNNVGIKYALSEGADYVFILNNDTTIEPDALDKLVGAAEEDPLVGAAGPAIKESDRTVFYGKISWLKPELKHSAVPPATFHLKFKEYLVGAGMLIKRSVLEKIEGFDEVYFLYFEDADFSRRAQLAGYKLKVAPEAVIHHQVSSSTKQLGSSLILRYHMRNALIFNSLNAPWTIKPLLIFWAGYVVAKNLVKMFLLPSKEKTADAIIDGVLDFYKNRFGKINTPRSVK